LVIGSPHYLVNFEAISYVTDILSLVLSSCRLSVTLALLKRQVASAVIICASNAKSLFIPN